LARGANFRLAFFTSFFTSGFGWMLATSAAIFSVTANCNDRACCGRGFFLLCVGM
jgi:hypothetical protein